MTNDKKIVKQITNAGNVAAQQNNAVILNDVTSVWSQTSDVQVSQITLFIHSGKRMNLKIKSSSIFTNISPEFLIIPCSLLDVTVIINISLIYTSSSTFVEKACLKSKLNDETPPVIIPEEISAVGILFLPRHGVSSVMG